jgi:hypothetical protein
MNDKKGTTDPSKRIIEQANLLAQGANFYNNDITDAFEFNNDFRPPAETQRDDNWSEKLFKNRLPRFLERIDIILNNTNTYQGGPNTLHIIGKCLKSPPVSDLTRDQILHKLNGYIVILTEINNKVRTILNYQGLPNTKVWTKVNKYLNDYLDELNTLSKVERRPAGALIRLEREELNMENPWTNSLGAQKDNQPSVSTGRAQSSSAATFASSERNMAGQNTAGIKRRRPESRTMTYEEAEKLEAKEEEKRRQEVRKQNKERDVRAQSGYMVKNKVKTAGGRRRQIRKTRKLKRRPRKITQRAGQRKRTMKRKSRSRKNTRRRR